MVRAVILWTGAVGAGAMGSGVKTDAGAIAEAGRAWREDQKRLAKAPKDDSMTPHMARLEPFQVLEIERMASQGMSLSQIGARLRYSPDLWDMMIKVNPEIANAYRAGAVRGVDIVTQAAFQGAQSGDSGLIKFYLERLGGSQFRKAPDGPAVVVNTGPVVQIDQEDIARRFERQRKLVDGTCEELNPDPALDP
jgi:hypothetical protein